MKLRTDFVTNSSSSSFLLATADGFTEKQKKAVLDFVWNEMVAPHRYGKIDPATYVGDDMYDDPYDYMIMSNREEAFACQEKGLNLCAGSVSFESLESISDLYQALWDALEEADPEHFVQIDTRLSF